MNCQLTKKKSKKTITAKFLTDDVMAVEQLFLPSLPVPDYKFKPLCYLNTEHNIKYFYRPKMNEMLHCISPSSDRMSKSLRSVH